MSFTEFSGENGWWLKTYLAAVRGWNMEGRLRSGMCFEHVSASVT
jgi:hypothetical protein